MNSAIHELAEAIGPSAAVRLCQAMGGARLRVPSRPDSAPLLVATLGLETAQRLCDLYRGDSIDLPAKILLRGIRNELIRCEYRNSSGQSGCRADVLAQQYGISRRHVFNVLSDSRPAAHKDQLELW